MKSFLALAVLAGVAVGIAFTDSTGYYAWSPHKELVYRFESQVLTGIPNLRSQYAGVKLSSDVIVQTFADYSLRIKFRDPRFIVVNEELQYLEGRPQIPKAQQEVPDVIRKALTEPFVAHLKRGVVEAIFVEKSEPVVVTNIKKALLTQLQLDLTASRKREVTVVQQEDNNSVEKNVLPKPILEDNTYFTTEEVSVVGDCQTSYTMHPLPKYQVVELERKLQAAERLLAEEGVIAGETSEGEQACRGKEYFEITKTKNFDNCKERPTFQSIRGMKNNCDFSKAECKDLMTQMSASKYIVCGTRKDFIIRQAQTDNDILTNPLGWTVTPEKMTLSARVTTMLLKVKSSGFQPLPKPQEPVEKRSLIYEFPQKSLWSTHETREISPRQETDKRGYQPILPMPDLNSGSSLLPAFIPIQELRGKIVEEMQKVVREIFQSPESCSSKADIAGSVHAIAQSLRPRSLEELEELERSLERASFSHENRKIAKEIWSDILAMTGSNACITLIKKKIESRQLVKTQASRVLQSAIRNVKTPTQELLRELVKLVKSLKSERVLYNTGLIQLANLMQHACIDPTERITQFPVRTYGLFCTRESEVVKEFIRYLSTQLKQSDKSDSERLVYIAALGKIGDRDVLIPLVNAIENNKTPLTRSVAVYSLKRLAKLQPTIVRPLLLKMIDNPAENAEVRIAAVSILPWTQPSVAQLQKIAVRSWFEPSKQVASFIHSTLKSLTVTQVPELQAVGQKAKHIDSLLKPFQYGIQFSHNSHTQKFVEYLRTVSSVETAYVNTAESLVPARFSLSNQMYGGVWQIDGLTFSIYTNGMDHLVDKVLGYFGYDGEVSEEVKQELSEIKEKLNISKDEEQRNQKTQTFIRYSMLGFERAMPVDNKIFSEILEKVSEQLRGNFDDSSDDNNKHFNLTYTNYAIKTRVLLPSMAGFPVLIRRNIPVVFGIKGNYLFEESNVPNQHGWPIKVKGSIIPVINGKVQSNMGIISPFTKKFIGAGVEASIHYSLPLSIDAEIDRKGEFSLAVKNLEKNRQEFHAIHAFVKPFTVVKSLERLVPLSKAASFKQILSGDQMKSYDLHLGRSVGIDAKLKVMTDYKQLDFPFVWEKLSQHNLLSVWPLSFMPVSARYASAEIMYNPAGSETQEIEARFRIVRGKKLSETELPEVSYPSLEDVDEDKEEEIKQICGTKHEHSTEVRLCEEKMLEKLESRRNSHKNVHKMLEKIESGHVSGLHLEASFNSGSSRNAANAAILIGSETKGREVKSIFEVKFQTPQKPAYELEVEAITELPEMPYRWDVQALIRENLKMESKIKVRYGKVDGEKQNVEVEAVLSKSEHQKESVRRSPELRKCEQEIQKGRELSSVCIETRHQAASVDKIWLKVRVPQGWKKSQVLNKVEAAAKAYLWSVMYEEVEFRQQEQQGESLVYEFDALVNRTGDVAQAWIKSPFSKIHFKNVSLPVQMRGLFPMSLRNGIPLRVLQKVTRSQAPASCRVEEKEVTTFDNKTYKYEMSKCQHLLFKDCSGAEKKRKVAVLAWQSADSHSHKDIKIISGNNIVELKKKGSEVEIKVNGKQESVSAGSTYKKYSKRSQKLELLIQRTRGDGVVYVSNPIEGLEVFYDGKKIEVVAPQLFHNRACGLCGDLNGENTADVKSAQDCVMRQSRYAAYTYRVKQHGSNEECQIPEEDRVEFEQDKRECTKTEVIRTKLMRLAKVLVDKKVQPISTRHVVEILENSVCISKTMIKVCGKGEKPGKVRRLDLSFACLTRGYSRTHQILRRAEAGEEIFQVRDLPTEFSKSQVEPVVCVPDSDSRGELEEEEEETGRRLNHREREELEENDRRQNNYRNREDEEELEESDRRQNNYRNRDDEEVEEYDRRENNYRNREDEEELEENDGNSRKSLKNIIWTYSGGFEWANRCKFNGGDIRSAQTTEKGCGVLCAATPRCTHFTYDGHTYTCYTKSGRTSKQDAIEVADSAMVCGIKSSQNTEEQEEQEYDGSSSRCRRNTHHPSRWADTMKPSERISRMCESGKVVYHGSESTMELKNFNKSDCLAAVEYARSQEHHMKQSIYMLWGDFTCGSMTILIRK